MPRDTAAFGAFEAVHPGIKRQALSQVIANVEFRAGAQVEGRVPFHLLETRSENERAQADIEIGLA
jgi:hypothetical protein